MPVLANRKSQEELVFGKWEEPYLKMVGLNHATLNFYMEIQLPLIGLMFLQIFLWFDTIPNFAAELSCYSDRQFYLDWWNSHTVEDFIHKWFKLPYTFFYRHGFVRLVLRYGVNETLARLVTFAVYAMSQELILVFSLGVYKLYVFKILCIALVWHVIQVNNLNWISPNNFNILTLFGFVWVLPLVFCMYYREYLKSINPY